MKYILHFLITILPLSLISQPFPSVELLATGFDRPVDIQNAGDDRLFILELDGYIKILNPDGTTITEPFLNIDDRVKNISGLSEQGLLGLAFHPNYLTNGFFFVNYVNNSGNSVISRFSRNTENSADPDSELILIEISQPFSNHNGGCMAFGNDGFLYISVGDGGSGGDPQDNAQDLTTLLGKILRIDIDNPDTGLNYGIPNDNPFLSTPTARHEIWAYGLRNPWKFSFDEINDDIWIADVGQGQIEEINVFSRTESGVNLGWRCYEGNNPYNLTECPESGDLYFPVAQYNHSMGRCSITGGYRYYGSEMDRFSGSYFFADYCSGDIGTVQEQDGSFILNFYPAIFNRNWSSFGKDNNGELYIAAANTGEIFKIFENELLHSDEFDMDKIKLYPNPASNELNISSIENISGTFNMKIIDLSGRRLKTFSLTTSDSYTLDILNLNPGIYFLQIEIGNSGTIKKFIKN